MKILFLTHRMPYPPNRGDRIRSYHILRFLSERAEVDLACLADEPPAGGDVAALRALCGRVAVVPVNRWARWGRALAALARGRSATEGLFRSPALVSTLRQWAADTNYDRILVYCSSMAQYADVGALSERPCITDLVDVDSQKWFDYSEAARGPLRGLYRLEGGRVRQLEAAVARRSHAVIVVSDAEAELLRRHCPIANVTAISNGVDLEYFRPTPPLPLPLGEGRREGAILPSGRRSAVAEEGRVAAGDSPERGEGAIPPLPLGEGRGEGFDCVFIGALDYRPNVDGLVWFCREVWPEVHRRFPQAKFTIVGRAPTRQVRCLASQPGVEVVGAVPDVRPYLWRARIVVVPLRIARGIQNKVLEAMAAGKPVIASPQAIEGLNANPGKQLIQADSPAKWQTAISELLSNDAECRRLAEAAVEYVQRQHRWESSLLPLRKHLSMASDAEQLIYSEPQRMAVASSPD